MEHWDEIRTAYHVARAGTVSGAAEALGVHHATVIRHVDALEARLGAKLFQRHARGYTATEAGEDLLRVAQATDDQFAQLEGRIKGQGEGVSGELVITSLGVVSTFLTPILAEFLALHPDVRIRYRTGTRLLRLEYGEAHVAIRAGARPDEPDNVVQPFMEMRPALVAHRDYLAQHGTPTSEEDLLAHRFIAPDDSGSRASFNRWLIATVGESRLCYRATSERDLREAILVGAGIGFLDESEAEAHPDLRIVMPHREDWRAPLWIVTHVDLHRTTKVQAFLKFLKDQVKVRIPE